MKINPQPKTKPVIDKKYLEFIGTQPCCVCLHPFFNGGDIVPAHQTIKVPSSVKGTGQKDHDCWALPLHYICHNEEHSGFLEIADRKRKILDLWLKYNPDLIDEIIDHVTRNWETLNGRK
jgi:hypothetical protein